MRNQDGILPCLSGPIRRMASLTRAVGRAASLGTNLRRAGVPCAAGSVSERFSTRFALQTAGACPSQDPEVISYFSPAGMISTEPVVGRHETSEGLRRKQGAGRRQALGRAGEAVAEDYLRQLGYRVVERNYRCPCGEVDLVAADGTTLVFVEVKTRSGTLCGSPLEAVDVRKQRRIAAAAQHFLVTRFCGGRAARFDVIGVLWKGSVPELEHVQNAFELV